MLPIPFNQDFPTLLAEDGFKGCIQELELGSWFLPHLYIRHFFALGFFD